MLRRHVVLLLVIGFAVAGVTQQNQPVLDTDSGPEFLPAQAPQSLKKCKNESLETATLDVLISSNGVPVQYFFLHALGDDADQVALDTVGADRFIPARQAGHAVQSHKAIAVDMDLCIEPYKRKDGTKGEHLTLAAPPRQRFVETGDSRSEPMQFPDPPPDFSKPYRIGGDISSPVPLTYPEARFTKEARKAHKQGICFISMIVDQHGMPVDPQVIKPLGMGLDENALEVVREYRFRPAMKDKQLAVPVRITVEVNYRLYDRPR